jgi:hypothetical protein
MARYVDLRSAEKRRIDLESKVPATLREYVYHCVTNDGENLTGKVNRRARRIKASEMKLRVTDAEFKALEDAKKK